MYTVWLLCVVTILLGFRSVECGMTIEQMEKAASSLRASCAQKEHAKMELVEGIRSGQFPDDPNLKCYTNCIMKKLRTFKNGALDLDMMLKQIDAMMPADMQPRVKAAATKCANEVSSSDPCDLTFQYAKCNYNADPEIFFFP